jgi:hypothetical protein
MLQIAALGNLKEPIPRLKKIPTRKLIRLRLYGSLSSAQRDLLKRGERLSVDSLTRRQQGMLLTVAQESRGWMNIEDLAGSTLQLKKVKLSTLEEGISLIAEYQLADFENSRDEIFRVPNSL